MGNKFRTVKKSKKKSKKIIFGKKSKNPKAGVKPFPEFSGNFSKNPNPCIVLFISYER